MSISNGHFIPPVSGYGRPSPPTVRRRIVSPPESAEPDREFIEGTPAQKTEPTLRSKPEAEPAPTERQASDVAKKKRKRASEEQKTIAIARVEALVKAGELTKKAVAKVAKELGYNPLTLKNWVMKARKAEPTRAAKKKTSRRVEASIAEHMTPLREPRPRRIPRGAVELAQSEVLAEQLIASLGSMVRTIVREEIRRMLA